MYTLEGRSVVSGRYTKGQYGSREEDNLQEQRVGWSHVWSGIERYLERKREVEASIGYEILRVGTKGGFSLLRICRCQI